MALILRLTVNCRSFASPAIGWPQSPSSWIAFTRRVLCASDSTWKKTEPFVVQNALSVRSSPPEVVWNPCQPTILPPRICNGKARPERSEDNRCVAESVWTMTKKRSKSTAETAFVCCARFTRRATVDLAPRSTTDCNQWSPTAEPSGRCGNARLGIKKPPARSTKLDNRRLTIARPARG